MKGQEGTVIGEERRCRYGRSCPGICRERLMTTTKYVRFGLTCSQNSSGHYMYCQFNTQQILRLPTQCVYVFSVDLLGAICSNYRPITLPNMAYKIFTILLNNRLSKIVDSKLSEAEAGFRQNRSTLDNIFITRQTFEKCPEYNIYLHNLFVDCLQAFDSVNRNKVKDSLNEYNIPSKLIKLIALTLGNKHNVKNKQ